jgi:uncharacterized membrane protein
MPWLFLAYPLLAHLATLLHNQGLAGLALAVFIAVPLLPALRQRKSWAWLVFSGCTLVLFLCARSGWAAYLMYLPPVLIPLSVLAVFAHSLRAGQTPIVTRVAAQIRSQALPVELQTYTRHVTQCWVVLLSMLAVGSVLLALFASARLWSVMTNIVWYVLIGAMFLIEYLYRRWRFRHLQHESFVELVAALFRNRMY